MKKLLVFALTAGLLLMQAVVYAQSDQTATKAPPVAQPLVREGDFAVRLVEALKIGTAKNEAEAESILTSSGITPRNGWIADYPMTPDVISELQKSVGDAADAQRIPMGKDEALKVFRTTAVESGLPITAEIPGRYAETQPPAASQYAESSGVDDYYSTEGPPVVTYYAPPWDYYYMYAWVPCPFIFSGFFFPGFFILHDFHKIIIINKKVVVVTNHFIDPKTKTVFAIDPVKRGTARDFRSALVMSRRTGFPSVQDQKGARSIFERNRTRTGTPTMPMDRGRGVTSSNMVPERSGRPLSVPSTKSEGSSSGHSMGGRGSLGTFHGGGGFSGHGGSRGGCTGRC